MSLFERWFRPSSKPGAQPSRGPVSDAASPAEADDRLVARTDEYNARAEAYWQDMARDPSGRNHVLNKPFSRFDQAADTLYRLGLVLAELDAGPGHVVLDFGAGSCWLSACLSRLGIATISVDVSRSALELGRELFGMDRRQRPAAEPRFVVFDGHRLPLGGESVDRIVCFDALHHVPNLDEVLAELARVLRSGGRAVLAEPGQGHSHSDESVRETERYGVLENDLDAADLERRALRAGFTDVRLKPYPDPSTFSVTVEQYRRMTDGDARAFPLAALGQGLRQTLIAVLSKGERVRDSHCPHLLRADIRRTDEGALRGRGGTSLPVALRLANVGDTLWRHEMNVLGGYVTVSGHVLDDDGRPFSSGFFKATLPRSIGPGETADIVVDLPLPAADGGRCRIRIDLVDEHVSWFSEAGSGTLDLEIELDASAAALRPHGLAAAITALPLQAVHATPGEEARFAVQIENRGLSAWPVTPAPTPGAVSLGAHLLDEAGNLLDNDFVHLPLPHPVEPGGRCAMNCVFRAPAQPGAYRLRLDLVLETISWFEAHGSATPEVPLIVVEPGPERR